MLSKCVLVEHGNPNGFKNIHNCVVQYTVGVIRQPINNEKYFDAVRAYTNLDFRQSVDILKEAIDTEGISPELLNLLGASYRFLDKPHRALPFLLLAFKLNPKTNYLVGNVALCLKMINYPSMDDACHFLMSYAVDEWSKNEIKNLETR